MLAGRGFGKTRAGAEWVRALATAGAARRIALVGDTADDVRHVMVEGPSGVLAIAPADECGVWNGQTQSNCRRPGKLRGPELRNGRMWRRDNLMLAFVQDDAGRCAAAIMMCG